MSEIAVAGIRPQAIAPISAHPTLSRAALSADVLRGTEAYAALAPEWRRLAERQNGATVFQTPEMLGIWAHHFATKRPDSLVTVVVKENGRAVLIWPLVIERSGLVRVARGAGTPVGQYDEILADPDCAVAETLRVATDALVRAARPDLILLERVRADSALHMALSDVAPFVSIEAAPYSDISQGVASFMQTLKTKAARNQRRRIRRFEEEGKVEFAIAASPAEAEAWLAEAIELKREWLSASGRVSRAFMRPETRECMLELARKCSGETASPRTVVGKLTLDGRTAAIEMGFAHNETYHLYLGAFTPDLAKFGPGNILTEKLLGWCVDRGIRRYDMLPPRTRNKLEWQTGEVPVSNYALPTTGRGRLHVDLVLQRLLPAMRRAFYALPEALRSPLAALALRNLGDAHTQTKSDGGDE